MAKKTKFVRKTDNLGRIVIPAEIRKAWGYAVNEKFDFELSMLEDGIFIKPYTGEPKCSCCGEEKESMTEVKNTYMCGECIRLFVYGGAKQ